MHFPLLIVGVLSTFFVCSEAFFGISVNIQLSKDIMKSGGEIATALGKISKGIDDMQKILGDTQSPTFIELKYNLIMVQNTIDLTAAFMTKFGKYASDTNGVAVTLFTEITDDLMIINGIFSGKMGEAVTALDTAFSTTSKSDIYDVLAMALTEIGTQIATVQTSVMGLIGKKVTESELNGAIDATAAASVKTQVASGAGLMVSLQTVFDKMMKKTKSLAAYAKVASTTVSAGQASIVASSGKAVKNCDTASKGFTATRSDLKTYKMTLEGIYTTLAKFEDTIVTAAVPAVIDALNIGLYATLVTNLEANIAAGVTASTLQSTQIVAFTSSIATDLKAALTSNLAYAAKSITSKSVKAESCFATFSVDFNNILKLYGSDLQKCIDNEADSISNIFAAFDIQNEYFKASSALVTNTVKQCVKASIMSSTSADIRAMAVLCLNAAIMTPDFKEPFTAQSTAIQMAITMSQTASMTRMTTCQTNAKAAYDADFTFYSAVYDLCAPA